MRRTIGLLGLAVVGILVVGWWSLRPPRVTGALWDHVGAPIDAPNPERVHINYAAFQFDHEPHSIVCLLRASGKTGWSTENLIPWVRNEDGAVVVDGREILPRRDSLQVFVAEGASAPTPIVLEGTDRNAFDRFIQSDREYQSCQKFWDELESRMIAARGTTN